LHEAGAAQRINIVMSADDADCKEGCPDRVGGRPMARLYGTAACRVEPD